MTPSDPQTAKFKLPRLVRLYIRQVFVGFALAAVFAGLLIGFNVANLRNLILTTSGGGIAAFILFFFNGLVFAGVQFGLTIMRMAEFDDNDSSGGKREKTQAAKQAAMAANPVRVEVQAGR